MPASFRASRALLVFAVTALLGLYWWMAVSVSPRHGTTADEIAHLTAGYSYWRTDDYRLQPENGNLPQRWAALPLLAMPDVRFPTLDQYSWWISDVWDLGFQFFYKSGNPLGAMLWAGRAMIALFGVAAGGLVFWWARKLHGDSGALLTLGLFAFSPTMLAHGGLITSDMAACFCFLAAVTAYWWLLHRLNLGSVLVFGLALGALSLAKFSAPLIVPMMVVLLAIRLGTKQPLTLGFPWHGAIARRTTRAVALIGASLAAAALAVALIWAAYGFRYKMYRYYEPGHVRSLVGWDVLAKDGGDVIPAVQFARAHHLLPESYLYGFAHTYRFSRYRPAFLNGEHRTQGWWWFFPYAFAVKTPLAFFGLLGLAVMAAAEKRRAGNWAEKLYPWSPLLVLFTVYWAFALTSHLNIGHRHILPTYLTLFVVAGGAVRWVRPGAKWLAVVLALLAGWFAAESLWIRPSYLAYFNELIGGPKNGYQHLVDSSLDWGQDLPGLKIWLDAHARGQRVFLSYFGSGDPVYQGIRATRVADDNFDLRLPRRFPAVMTGGIYCISATQLQQVYSRARGRWDAAKEADYQRQLRDVLLTAHAPGHELPLDQLKRFEDFQFARLCHFLQKRRPVAEVGYSILIFELSDQEVATALYGPLPSHDHAPAG